MVCQQTTVEVASIRSSEQNKGRGKTDVMWVRKKTVGAINTRGVTRQGGRERREPGPNQGQEQGQKQGRGNGHEQKIDRNRDENGARKRKVNRSKGRNMRDRYQYRDGQAQGQ